METQFIMFIAGLIVFLAVMFGLMFYYLLARARFFEYRERL